MRMSPEIAAIWDLVLAGCQASVRASLASLWTTAMRANLMADLSLESLLAAAPGRDQAALLITSGRIRATRLTHHLPPP